MAKKRPGSAKRFGARYGRNIRKKITEIEKKQKKTQICPYCKRKAVKRIAAGIWFCNKCKAKFAGNAYTP